MDASHPPHILLPHHQQFNSVESDHVEKGDDDDDEQQKQQQRQFLGLSEHISCPLCGDFLSEAVTLTGCLHFFCRLCLQRHLSAQQCAPNSTCHCPKCYVQLGPEKPFFRHDVALQELVYKLVPNIFWRRLARIARSRRCASSSSATNKSLSERHILKRQRLLQLSTALCSPDEKISVQIDYVPLADILAANRCGTTQMAANAVTEMADDGPSTAAAPNGGDVKEVKKPLQKQPQLFFRRFFRCAARVRIEQLKQLLEIKLAMSDAYGVYFVDGALQNVLEDDYTLEDIVQLFNWDRQSPLLLRFTLAKLSQEEEDKPPVLEEMPQLEVEGEPIAMVVGGINANNERAMAAATGGKQSANEGTAMDIDGGGRAGVTTEGGGTQSGEAQKRAEPKEADGMKATNAPVRTTFRSGSTIAPSVSPPQLFFGTDNQSPSSSCQILPIGTPSAEMPQQNSGLSSSLSHPPNVQTNKNDRKKNNNSGKNNNNNGESATPRTKKQQQLAKKEGNERNETAKKRKAPPKNNNNGETTKRRKTEETKGQKGNDERQREGREKEEAEKEQRQQRENDEEGRRRRSQTGNEPETDQQRVEGGDSGQSDRSDQIGQQKEAILTELNTDDMPTDEQQQKPPQNASTSSNKNEQNAAPSWNSITPKQQQQQTPRTTATAVSAEKKQQPKFKSTTKLAGNHNATKSVAHSKQPTQSQANQQHPLPSSSSVFSAATAQQQQQQFLLANQHHLQQQYPQFFHLPAGASVGLSPMAAAAYAPLLQNFMQNGTTLVDALAMVAATNAIFQCQQQPPTTKPGAVNAPQQCQQQQQQFDQMFDAGKAQTTTHNQQQAQKATRTSSAAKGNSNSKSNNNNSSKVSGGKSPAKQPTTSRGEDRPSMVGQAPTSSGPSRGAHMPSSAADNNNSGSSATVQKACPPSSFVACSPPKGNKNAAGSVPNGGVEQRHGSHQLKQQKALSAQTNGHAAASVGSKAATLPG